jgi:hypothetical protein
VDDYGAFQELPPVTGAGRVIEVAGNLRPPAVVAGVGVSRVDLPYPRDPNELRPTRGYEIPSPYVMYWPRGSRTPIELNLDPSGTAFWIHVPLGAEGERGLYEVSVWARFPGEKVPALVSLRTVLVY